MRLKYNRGIFHINSLKYNKKGFEFSFAWLFAIIVGAFILFLAIYAVTKILDTGRDITSAKTGKEIGILLNPLETSFETAGSTLFTMPVETRIYNRCDNGSVFGKQIIKVAQKNFNKWTDTDIDIGFQNKYIFSENFAEGKNFFVFSKPFEFPFKVADLIYLTSANKKYCFVNAPDEIEEEISDLNQENLLVQQCPDDSIKICFRTSRSECDIIVNGNSQSVEKNGQVVYYETNALMYAAIFADKGVYECQVSRLMKRTNELLYLYSEKYSLLSERGCSSGVNSEIISFRNLISDISNSEQLVNAVSEIKYLEAQNELAGEGKCRLW